MKEKIKKEESHKELCENAGDGDDQKQGIEKEKTPKESIDANSFDEEITERLVDEDDTFEKKQTKKNKWMILGIFSGILIISVAMILINQMQKTNTIQKELDLGDKYLEEGKYTEARLAYDKVIEIEPKVIKAYEGKAASYLKEANYNEAENVINTAQTIETTVNSDVLLAEVYYATSREDLGNAKMESVTNSDSLDYESAKNAGALFEKRQEYLKAEQIYENSITKTKDKQELTVLFDGLINTSLLMGKSTDEINVLLDRAKAETGNDGYKIEAISDTADLDVLLNTLYSHWWAGLPKDFAAIENIDIDWLINVALVERSRQGVGSSSKAIQEKYDLSYFMTLKDVENDLKMTINPKISLPDYDERYNRLRGFTWIQEEKGFGWRGKGGSATETEIIIHKADKLNNKIYVTASELVIKNQDKYKEYTTNGDKGDVYCDDKLVGSGVFNSYSEKTKSFQVDLTLNEDLLTNWTYILEENPNGGYYLISKMKNATN